jgi:hypothetical protein
MIFPFSFWRSAAVAPPGIYDNMIAHWPFEEAIGTRTDVISAMILSELFGSVNSAAGKIADGVNIDRGDATALDAYIGDFPALAVPLGDFTYALWVKPTADMSIVGLVLGVTLGAEWDFTIFIDNDAGDIGGVPNGLAVNILGTVLTGMATAVVTLDEWTHVVVTREGSTAKLYVNGALITSETVSTGSGSAENFTVGYSYDLGEFFNGVVDQLLVWDRAIGGDEIATIYNAGDGISL